MALRLLRHSGESILSRMDAEKARAFLRKLPHVKETQQWGDNLVYWVGDKAKGGKMFALIDLADRDDREERHRQNIARARRAFFSFYAGPMRFAELLEYEGVIPAPYLARAYWVALTAWGAIPPDELRTLMKAAHKGVLERMTQKAREQLSTARKVSR